MPPSSAAAYQSLTAFKPRTSTDVQGEADAKYDVAGSQTRLSSLRGLVGNLQSSVEAVDPSVTGRTSGTFTTEGQRQALVSKERAPILGDLSKQQGYASEAQQTLNTSQNLASQMASALLSDDKQTYQRLLDQYNAATAAEQAAEAKRQWEAAQAEQKRQFDAQVAESRRASGSGGAGGYDVSSLLQGLQGEKKFIGNDDFRGRLAYEAKKGNKNAALALKYVGNDGKYYINFTKPPDYVTNWNAVKQALNAIGAKNTWGGR